MKDDIKHLLDGALGDAPPIAVDSEDATARGRVALGRRRRLAGSGIAAAVLAGALTVTLAMNTVGGDGGVPSGASPSASGPSVHPSPTDPVDDSQPFPLHPDGLYKWALNTDQGGNELTAFTDAYWNVLNERYGIQRPQEGQAFQSEVWELNRLVKEGTEEEPEDVVEPVGYRDDRVVLRDGVASGSGNHVDPELILPGSAPDTEDTISIAIFAPGAYSTGTNKSAQDNRPGPGEGFFDLIDCREYSFTIQLGIKLTMTPDCQFLGGGSAIYSETTRVSTSGPGSSIITELVVFRSDGSAVVIKDQAWPKDHAAGLRDATLKQADLMAIAGALPGWNQR
ncbi:hypothetical protein Afil01_58110 [Actinorhabdospora filicis]|uniref:Uncharacterized protein n=1 Tax=Actinorhabdospora filicis TaxID=1785913 RepID=A0A9W6WBV4_9ACTN|nr:hypothetical protein [Actinorhabdospora filicis]GLZ81004.1 hypothetical protein Afil01_58110 [Actinorhabdospora filicis]